MFSTFLFVGAIAVSFAQDIKTEELLYGLDGNINIEVGLAEDRLSNSSSYEVERIYFGKKPNWNIYSCLEYNYSEPDPTPISNSPQSVPINIDIVARSFEDAGVDFDKYRFGVTYIVNLDFSRMIERIIYEKAFETPSDANYAINEYKKFLILYLYLTATSNVTDHDSYLMVPSMSVDQFWHWHILDVEEYIYDCMKICGHTIHHLGRHNVPDDKWVSRFDEILIAYENVFGYPSPAPQISNCGMSDTELLVSNSTMFNLQTKEIDYNVLSKSFTAAGIDFNKVSDYVLRLIDLDLSPIIPRLIAEFGYKNEEECNFALTEYKKFWVLYMYLRGTSLTGDYVEFGSFVPPYPVDLVWHAHILDTEKYIADSIQVLDVTFYHNPRFYLHVDQFPSVQAPKYAILWNTYPIIFGYEPPFQMWGDSDSIAAQCCGGACFTAGTKVTMCDDKLTKAIEDIVVGDSVRGKDYECVEVVKLDPKPLGNRKLYSFNGQNRYFATSDHPFMTEQGWKSLEPQHTLQRDGVKVYSELTGKLQIGDSIWMGKGYMNVTSIQSKEMNDPHLPLYNFQVSNGSSYFADGYMVHTIK